MAKKQKGDNMEQELEQPLLVEKESVIAEKKVQTLDQLPGVGPATIEKLNNAGYTDLMSLAVATPGELVGAADMSEATAKKVIAIARANLEMNFESGEYLLQKRESIIKITTGSKALDKLCGGGIESGAITEAFGQYGSGKSQLAHVLAARCMLPVEKGGADGVVVFIDTEGTFRPERIVQMVKGINPDADPQDFLKNIKVARALNTDHQMLLAEKVADLIKNKGMNVKLVIVDSLTSHFRAEFIGRGTLAERQQKLNKHMHTLIRLADRHNVAVYVTNQVMSKPDMFFGDPTQAIGGHVVGHNSTYRIYLRRGKKGSRVAKMIDAPNLAEDEAAFMILENGIKDA
ncbi:DNA repair and recombination protein RadA [Candidatus Woesearchaeota archaeon]|nr:DNA repair and recombination protein RadA [Candidatus Woesearchaeota archaeon]MBW2994185.1 DNA repair and recombination protein RadA [Candidatus Woesearchaeota archaeon]